MLGRDLHHLQPSQEVTGATSHLNFMRIHSYHDFLYAYRHVHHSIQCESVTLQY